MRVATGNIGTRIRQARARIGWKAVSVADAIGVHEQTLSKWERGASYPSRRNIDALAALFGVSVAELTIGPLRRKTHAA